MTATRTKWFIRDSATEVVVIDLMGEIQPERFGDVMMALEVDSPDVRVAGTVN